MAKKRILNSFLSYLNFLFGKHIRNPAAVCNWCLKMIKWMGLCSSTVIISENQVSLLNLFKAA